MLGLLVMVLNLFPVTTALQCPKNLTATPFPQFQVVAAAKTGSTSLFSYLCQLPSINCIARKKETNLLRDSKLKVGSEQVTFRKLFVWTLKYFFDRNAREHLNGIAKEDSECPMKIRFLVLHLRRRFTTITMKPLLKICMHFCHARVLFGC